MNISKLVANTRLLAVAGAAGIAMVSVAEAKVLKVQTSLNSGDFAHTYLVENWVPKLAAMSGGSVEIELLPTRSVVPHRETPEAVSVGILDGDMTATAYFAGREPAFALMGDLIAGYDTPDQIQTFCMNGGGKEMLQKIYDTVQPGIHVVGCDAYNREALVSTVPIRGIADLEGVKIRAPEGLASEVFLRAGAAPVAIPNSETYTALEKGVVDAADNSAYSNNDASGMHDIAKFPIYPGIHSMAFIQFTINQDVWDGLSDGDKAAIETWYIAARTDLRRAVDLEDKRLVARDRAAGDLEIIDWPQADRDALREIAAGAWEDFANQSDLAKETYNTHIEFMKLYGLLK